jgi:hypothetical protein
MASIEAAALPIATVACENLLFAELAGYPYDSTVCRLVDQTLLDFGWTPLPLLTGKSWFKGRTLSRDWYDPNHPRPAEVSRIVVDLLALGKVPAGSRVLVVGDSTTAFCRDSKKEITGQELTALVLAQTGVDVYWSSVSGTHFSSWKGGFKEQLQSNRGWRYDYVLLVGGWNELLNTWCSSDYLYEAVLEFTAEAAALVQGGL